MKFDTPATENPIDQLKVIGQPLSRIDGPLKTTGRAPYAYERHDVAGGAAYGYVVGSAIAKGNIERIELSAAQNASGVLAVVTAENAGKLGKGKLNYAKLLAGPEIEHYHQAIALVVAETFEQARSAAELVKVSYTRSEGSYDLATAKATGKPAKIGSGPADTAVGDFAMAFASAPVQLDQTYSTPDETHAMMEPHATTAVWNGDKLSVWTSNQMVDWGRTELALNLAIPKENVRIGGGFGAKLFVRSDAVLAALGARAVASHRSRSYILGRCITPSGHHALLFGRGTYQKISRALVLIEGVSYRLSARRSPLPRRRDTRRLRDRIHLHSLVPRPDLDSASMTVR